MVDSVRSTADLLDNLFQDGQATASITAQDVRDFVLSAEYLHKSGWEFVFDATYPAIGSARVITDAMRTQMTIAVNVGEDLRYPPSFPGIWDSTNNEIAPAVLNGAGIIRLSFGAWQVSQNTTFDIEVDVSTGGSGNVIYRETGVFSKGFGVGNPQFFNFIMPLFVGADFSANGAKIFITPSGSDVSVYQTTLTGLRTFAPNPSGDA